MAATDIERLIVQLEARMGNFEKELRRASGVFDKQARGIERRQKQMEGRLQRNWSNIGRGLIGPLTGISAALSTREIIRYGDAWTTAKNKITASGTPIEQVGQRMRDLTNLAVESRGALESTVTLYSRLQRGTENLGKSQQDLLRYTETINKAFVVGGAATSEQIAGVLQLTQAISSGILQGDELRSVRENASVIAQGIADVMGTNIGGLKQLGAEGKITVDVILKALERIQPAVDKAFGSTEITVTQALNNVETRFTELVGKLSDSGAMAELAGGINFIAENLDDLAKAAAIAAAALAPGGLVVAARMAATAVGTLTAVMLANPWLALAAAVAAAGAAIYLYTGKSADLLEVEKRLNTAKETSVKLSKQVADGHVSMRRETALAAIADADAALTKLEYNKQLALSIALEKESLRQRQKNSIAKVAVGKQASDAMNEVTAIEEQIRSANETLKSLRANLEKTEIGGGLGSGASSGKDSEKQKAFERELARLQKRTAVLDAQAQSQDRSTYALERAEAAARLYEAAEQDGIAKTPELIALIDQKAEAYARAAANMEMADAFQDSDDQLRQLRDEAALVGLDAEAVARLTIQQQLLNAARQAGVEITDALLARIDAAAEQHGREAARIDEVTKRMMAQVQVADAVRDGLLEVGTAAILSGKNFKDSLARMAESVAELILQLYVLKPLIESVFGAGGSVFGGLFGGGGGISSVAASDVATFSFFAKGGVMTPNGPRSLPRYARGGVSRQPAIFGEAGPEAAVPLPDGRSIPVKFLQLPSMQGGNQQFVINTNVNVESGGGMQAQSGGSNDRQARQLGSAITEAVRNEIANQKRQGGLLWQGGGRR